MTVFTMSLSRLALPVLLLSAVASAGGAGGPVSGVSAAGPCVPGFVKPSADALSRDLASARVRWQASGIRRYSFVFDQVAQPVRYPRTLVTVFASAGSGNIGVSARALEPGTLSAQISSATVEGLFMTIRDGIAYARTEPCAELKVTYARDGHPLTYTYENRRLNIADGGASWRVSAFKWVP